MLDEIIGNNKNYYIAEELSQLLLNQYGATTNVENKIRNTSLSKYQGLMPLFELISNSIHSIEERKKAGLFAEDETGRIIGGVEPDQHDEETSQGEE